MRVITKGPFDNIEQAVSEINKRKTSSYLHSFYADSMGQCYVIMLVNSYPDYTRVCAKWGDEPLTTEEYFK